MLYFDMEFVENFAKESGYTLFSDNRVKYKDRLIFGDNENYKYYISFERFRRGIKIEGEFDRFGKRNIFNIENIINWTKINGKYFLYEIPFPYEGIQQELKIVDDNGYFYSLDFTHLRYETENGSIPEIASAYNKYSLQNIQHYLNINNRKLHLLENQEYTKGLDKLLFHCDVCNKKDYFKATFSSILTGRGCPECGMVNRTKGRKKFFADKCSIIDHSPELLEEWSDLNEKSPYEYSYGSGIRVFWKCLNGLGHPDYFSIIVTKTRMKEGCPLCSESHGEKFIRKFANKQEIIYFSQYIFDDCKYKRNLKFDFFFPDFNCLLEAQGHQHYFPVRFGGMDIEDATKEFEKNKERDQIKRDYCKNNNIKLIEIPFWEFDKIEDILIKELNLTSEERRI